MTAACGARFSDGVVGPSDSLTPGAFVPTSPPLPDMAEARPLQRCRRGLPDCLSLLSWNTREAAANRLASSVLWVSKCSNEHFPVKASGQDLPVAKSCVKQIGVLRSCGHPPLLSPLVPPLMSPLGPATGPGLFGRGGFFKLSAPCRRSSRLLKLLAVRR